MKVELKTLRSNMVISDGTLYVDPSCAGLLIEVVQDLLKKHEDSPSHPDSGLVKVEEGYVLLMPWMLEHGLKKSRGDEFDVKSDPFKWCRCIASDEVFSFETYYYRRPISAWNASEIGKRFPVKEGV